MKILLLIISIILNFIIINTSKTRCNNPLNSNLNPHQTKGYISSPTVAKNEQFCKNLNGKSQCCTEDMFEEQKDTFDQFKREFNIQNALQVGIFDENIRDILKNQNVALDSVETYNNALENIDQTQEALEVMRDNLPTIEEGENSFNITDNGQVFNLTVGDTVYNFTGTDIDDYFDENSKMIRDSIDILDGTITSLVDLEIFRESNFVIREKKGDHYSIRIDKDALKNEFQLAQERIRNHIPQREKCFTALTSYFAANRCLQCEADWEELGIGLNLSTNSKILFNVNTETCNNIISECYDYIDSAVEMNQNAILYVFVMSSKNMVDSGVLPETGNFNSVETTEEELSFLSAMNVEFSEQIPLTTFFVQPPECEDKETCYHLCKTFIESTGVDLEVMFQDNVEENVDEILLQVEDFFDGEDGEDNNNNENVNEEQDPETVMDSDNMFYRDYNTLNPFEYSKDINGNFKIEGASGVKIFNYTGDQTYDDLFIEPLVAGDDSKKNNIERIQFQIIIFAMFFILQTMI